MDEKEYLEQRLQDQIDWYDGKSGAAKRWFIQLRVVEIVAAAAIPLVAGFSGSSLYAKIFVGVLGLLVSVVAGMLSLLKLQENWIEYRSTSESLKHEKYLFLTRAEPYNVEQPLALLVQRVESFISKENSGWAQSTRSLAKPKDEEH